MKLVVKQMFGTLQSAFKKDFPIYVLIASYITISALVAYRIGFLDDFSLLIYPGLTLKALAVLSALSVASYGFYLMLVVRPERPLRILVRRVFECCNTSVFARGILLFPVMLLFFSAMSSFKTLILPSMTFSWDQHLILWDRWLHGGIDPWQIIDPFLGGALATFALNLVYNLWLLVMLAVLFWFMFLARNEVLRLRFFLSFVLCWAVNGSLLAMLFASSGPGFFQYLYPEQANPYQGLMDSLRAAEQVYPVWALGTQQMLWDIYQSGELGVGGGISAMPSMHVSIACLIFLVAREHGRAASMLGAVFLFVILVGSVRLAWHYAIDGYLSLCTTGMIWLLSGYFTSWAGRFSNDQAVKVQLIQPSASSGVSSS
ncbi:phosphatase PAP2 family protein [Spongiibacter tropicus]|uniref:phosphatase PAP2 family protein n=1 Tax=Spongiibacter tropicus TaxID=454602 RepID=UPI003A997B1B